MARDLGADCDSNFWATWRHIGSRTGTVHEDNDVIIVETGSSLATFNPVFVRRVPDDAIGFIRHVVDRPVPVVMIVNPAVEGVDRLTAAAAATGLIEGQLAGMALDNLSGRNGKVTASAAPRELTIEFVAGEVEWRAYFDVLCRGFDIPPELVGPITDPAIYEGEGVAAFIGSVDGSAVATSLAFLHDDVAGIYNVATLPALRGRGFGAAMTAAAVAWGRDRRASVAVLQASAMGYPVYLRMGFRSVAPYVQLVVPA